MGVISATSNCQIRIAKTTHKGFVTHSGQMGVVRPPQVAKWGGFFLLLLFLFFFVLFCFSVFICIFLISFF
jgi:hypothetical protein